MNLLGYNFSPKIWAVIVSVVFVIIFIELGKWQLSRAEEKNTRQEQLDLLSKEPVVRVPGSVIKLEEYQYRTVEVIGEYRPEEMVYLDNKTYKGHAGYHILMPIQLSNSSLHVVVNRGWVATGKDRSILPAVLTEQGEVKITGLAVSPDIRTLELSKHMVEGMVWENFTLQRYKETTGYDLQPIMILQNDQFEDGLIREWPRPDSGSAKNYGYAVQWFALAITTIIIFLILNVKRQDKKNK